MEKTATAIGIKFLLTFIAAWIAISVIAGNAWTWALLVAILGTAINYLIDDRFVLPNYGNVVASLGDGVLSALLLFIMGLIIFELRPTVTSIFAFGVLVAIGEYFFHQYLIKTGIVEIREPEIKS